MMQHVERQLPALNNELIRRFELIDAIHAQQRMQGILAQPGNPWGIEIAHFGRAIALKAANLPNPFFNRVVGLGCAELADVANIAQFYRATNTAFSVELLPNDINDELSSMLTQQGLRHTRFHAGFFGSYDEVDFSDDTSIVESVTTKVQFQEFLETNFSGFELPEFIKDQIMVNMSHWLDIPNWHLYLARVGNTAAACGILQIENDIGYLASAATTPQFRRRGLQKALLNKRILEALNKGCQMLCSQAEFGSISHNNLERAGLRLAYTKAIWTSHVPSSQ